MNPRAGSKPAYSLSRGAPSASWVLLHTMPLEYDSIVLSRCQHQNFSLPQKQFSNAGNIFLLCRVYKAYNQIEGECTMDDLKFDSSALLIVGMLIGVVYALL